ncbi:hypothetical protein GCM10007967_08170 [Xylanimonas ulmi]
MIGRGSWGTARAFAPLAMWPRRPRTALRAGRGRRGRGASAKGRAHAARCAGRGAGPRTPTIEREPSTTTPAPTTTTQVETLSKRASGRWGGVGEIRVGLSRSAGVVRCGFAGIGPRPDAETLLATVVEKVF